MSQTTIQLPRKLFEAVNRRALAQRKTPDTLIAEWVSAQLAETGDEETQAAFEREAAAFARLQPALLTEYAGQYVAIYGEQVVAVGDERLALVKQVYEQFGEVPCYVEKVSIEPLRQARIPSVWRVR